MILPIIAYGDPVLRKVCEDVQEVDSSVKELISNMWETMYNARGIGLAAPQVGESIRIFLVDTTQIEEDLEGEKGIKKVFINAEILERDGEEWAYNEGCLSIPQVREDVEREEKILIRYLDESFNEHEEEYSGIAARVIQHEYDHIEGILFTDHLLPRRKTMIKSKLEAITRGKVKVDYKMRFPRLKKKVR